MELCLYFRNSFAFLLVAFWAIDANLYINYLRDVFKFKLLSILLIGHILTSVLMNIFICKPNIFIVSHPFIVTKSFLLFLTLFLDLLTLFLFFSTALMLIINKRQAFLGAAEKYLARDTENGLFWEHLYLI